MPSPLPIQDPADVQATFCATLVDSWLRLGLRHAVVAPGSRSTPMALALASRPEVAVHVLHDERSASFVALGIGLATGTAAVLLCTSGTAATHFHAAVVEASLSNVPMVVLTADRPPELRDVGAPQTIDQTRLYGGAPRWFHDPGVPAQEAIGSWRSLAQRTWSAASGIDAGPVHLNLPFREPLVGTAAELPSPAGGTWSTPVFAPAGAAALRALAVGRRGLIVAGRGVDDALAVERLAAALGWPVLADPRSGCRTSPHAIGAFDAMLRSAAFASAHLPELVLRLGEPPASKVLAQWLAAVAVQVQIDDSTRVFDPDQRISHRLTGPVGATCTVLAASVTTAAPADWFASWSAAERTAQATITAALDGALTEPAVARLLTTGALASGGHVVVASSMPIRDVEWFGGSGAGVTVHANRGANGIDGVVATAIGVAIGSGSPTAVLLGDVALCHDASSLTALAGRGLDLTIVVVDNDGGGIFSFLPQAERLPPARFEQLFGTPHGTDVVALAAAHGLPACTAGSPQELRAAVAAPGTKLVRVVSERTGNVAVHRRINDAVVAALAAH